MLRWILVCLVALCLALGADAKTKRALIVGVGDYEQLPDLQKTTGDATGYSEAFGDALGFEVTRLIDPGTIEFLEALDGFLQSIEPGDEVAFIFSGHGWSDGADNFLALTDAPLESSEFALRRQTVSLSNDVLAEIKARKPGLLFAIVDACRDNPFDTGTRSVTRGLSRLEIVPGTLVVYAAGTRQKALDRLGPEDESPYSVFTRSLLPRLSDPANPLLRSVDETRTEVATLASSINHEQRPAIYSDVSLDYCFAGACRVETGMDQETTDWVEISSAGYTAVDPCTKYARHLEHYPNGKFADVARRYLANPPCARTRLKLKDVSHFGDLNGHSDEIYGVDYSPSGRFVASASADNTARLWIVGMSADLFGETTEFTGHTAPVLTVRFSPDEERLITASEDGTARIWSAIGGEARLVLDGHQDVVSYAEYSPFGDRVITASYDETARIWDSRTGEEMLHLTGHSGAVRSARFNFDASRIVTASNDGTVRLWNAETGEQLRMVESSAVPATYATFSPDGERILVASADKVARIWSAGGEVLELTGHDAPLWNAAFSADGEFVATSAMDLSGRIWDAETGAFLAGVQDLSMFGANWIEFAPDGKRLVVSMKGGAVQLWQLSFEAD
jgi:WD40 repeat protein